MLTVPLAPSVTAATLKTSPVSTSSAVDRTSTLTEPALSSASSRMSAEALPVSVGASLVPVTVTVAVPVTVPPSPSDMV